MQTMRPVPGAQMPQPRPWVTNSGHTRTGWRRVTLAASCPTTIVTRSRAVVSSSKSPELSGRLASAESEVHAVSAPRPHRPWTRELVVDADLPAFALRTYLEHADLRSLLQSAHVSRPLASACELGSGYGRMTVVLGEFAARVVGFEREPEFAEAARRLHPAFAFERVEGLDALPVPSGVFDLVLTFTVLQHRHRSGPGLRGVEAGVKAVGLRPAVRGDQRGPAVRGHRG
ncbi:methyltransferase domain-containing protein [Mesorhizobium kowhaii]|uniref:Methyltransferase type 11 domain-containing protein n=1 Tax=Mesorhizobium kowhaii TaxID=1300272 RepID=A0A2W7C3Z7_9HYPH|nr:hypothetical protein B5V02_15010 [Mesorhizobium kowhaii]